MCLCAYVRVLRDVLHNFHFRVCLSLTADQKANRNCGMLPAGLSVCQSGNGNRLHLFNFDNDLALLTSWLSYEWLPLLLAGALWPTQQIVVRSSWKRIFKMMRCLRLGGKLNFHFHFEFLFYFSSCCRLSHCVSFGVC